jgi:predicted nuclease with TOPRIM domain|tara:strand:- start:991 stop:1191 length:201 start_codon:yes stop_codon:yes gene_type:complete
MADVSTLNNTLEEELRVMLVEKNNENQSLKNHIELLEKAVAEEQEQKYRLLVENADLKKEIRLLGS